MISFTNVTLDYPGEGGSLRALDNLTFSVEKGDSLAIIGPSGCGKSSLLHLAAGLVAPTFGVVEVDGKIVLQCRTQTAFIPQTLGLFPWMTAVGNVMFPLRMRHMNKSQARRVAMEALEQTGLSDFAKSYPKELSGGMRQRLALARALAPDCDVMLLDEPFSALDALSREQMQSLLAQLWHTRKHTQVLVTHSIEEAVFLGKHILVLSQRPATVQALIENPHAAHPEYRMQPEFLSICNQVREQLGDLAFKDAGNPAGDKA